MSSFCTHKSLVGKSKIKNNQHGINSLGLNTVMQHHVYDELMFINDEYLAAHVCLFY